MNRSVRVIRSEVEGSRGRMVRLGNEILRLRCAPLRMTTTEPDPPGTDTRGKSSRARNISRPPQQFASKRLCECCVQSGLEDLFRYPPQSALRRVARSRQDQSCFSSKNPDDFDQAARKID